MLDFSRKVGYVLDMSNEMVPSFKSKTKRKGHPQTNPNSLKNLKPFPPGTNGNPHPGYSLALRLKDAMRKPLVEPAPDATAGELIVYATLKGALECEPSSAHLREVWDRVDGKVIEKRDITFDGEGLSDILGKLRGYNQQDEALSYKIRPLEIESRPVASPEIDVGEG